MYPFLYQQKNSFLMHVTCMNLFPNSCCCSFLYTGLQINNQLCHDKSNKMVYLTANATLCSFGLMATEVTGLASYKKKKENKEQNIQLLSP
jgi:hypothetical protein